MASARQRAERLRRAQAHQDTQRQAVAQARVLKEQVNYELRRIRDEHGEDVLDSIPLTRALVGANHEALIEILCERGIIDRATYEVRRLEKILPRLSKVFPPSVPEREAV